MQKKRNEARLCAFRINSFELRARACELRRRNEKKARQAEKRFLLYTMTIMLS
jgi:hypothetical protein